MQFHLKISTSFNEGISKVFQSSPEQIICIDKQKTLKFYNFQDKTEKMQQERFEKELKAYQAQISGFYENLEADMQGCVEIQDLDKLVKHFCQIVTEKSGRAYSETQLLDAMDIDQSGLIEKQKIRLFMTKRYTKLFKPLE